MSPTRLRVEVLTVAGWHVQRDLSDEQAASAIALALTQPITKKVRLDIDDVSPRRTEFKDGPCTS